MQRNILLCVLCCFVCLCGCGSNSSELELISLQDTVLNEEGNGTIEDNITDSIFVYVCGAVEKEGVYELPRGSRVFEAVEKAGGFTIDAAYTQINQAEILEDEARIYIPTIEEIADEQLQTDGKVNINTASKEELMTLPGVGEAKASQIIQYRESYGAFQNVEDLMNISGIKEGLFNKIKDDIKI